jgi:hypothetical protein
MLITICRGCEGLAEWFPTVERERAKPAISPAKQQLDHLYASW